MKTYNKSINLLLLIFFCSFSLNTFSALDKSFFPGNDSALIIVDAQNCFVKGGTLAVNQGAEIVTVINKISGSFPNIILTQDWHPQRHISFASSHSGGKPGDTVETSYGKQILWPDHCVQGSKDAELLQDLKLPQAQLIIRKGYRKEVDSYSAFAEADHTSTGLAGYLKERGIKNVYIVGLATDFCVAYTALDARTAGFNTSVIEDATRAINVGGSLEKAWEKMHKAGIHRIQSSDISVSDSHSVKKKYRHCKEHKGSAEKARNEKCAR